jgi:NO-binding membrane sensor protein with MHYT domain
MATAAPGAPRSETTGQEKSLATHVTELYELVLAYARQETLDPVKSLGRFVGLGIVGSITLGLGVVIMLLAGLRALQTATGSTFQGNLSWAPYGIVAGGCVVFIALAMAIRARRPKRGGPSRP